MSSKSSSQHNGGENGKKNGGGHHGKGSESEKEAGRKRHPSNDSQVSFESMEEYIPTPPDGGWGWVIVGASLVGNLIVDGISYSFGVFLLEFVEAFKEPKSKIALVGSLLSGMYLFVGPIVSAMTNKFGCRPVVIIGSILSSAAFTLATFSPNVEMLIITYGVIGGFGLGMMYLPSIISVGYYFESKRAFATGLAVCGSGFGTFMFPPLTEFLLEEYAWQGGLLIIAGIILHGCICGVLMRPLQAKPIKRKKSMREKPSSGTELKDLEKGKESYNRTRCVSESSANTKKGVLEAKLAREKTLQDNESEQGSLPCVSGTGTEDVADSPSPAVTKKEEEESADGHISPEAPSETKMSETTDKSSEYFTPPDTVPNTPLNSNGDAVKENGDHGDDRKESTDSTEEKLSKIKTTAQFMSEFAPLLEVPAPRIPNGAAVKTSASGPNPGPGGSRTNMLHILTSERSLHVSKRDLARPLYRKDIFYSGSVLNIPQFQSQPDMKTYITSITTIPGEMEFVDGPSPTSKVLNLYCSCIPRPARDVLSEMADVSLLKDISFMLICLGNITAFLGFFIPFVYIVDRAVSLGVDKSQAAFLISIIGITNTGGRVLVGKLADMRIVDSLVITYLSIALCGLMTMLIPFCDTYPLLATAAALFGLGVAAFISLSSIIICDRMGLEKLTNAFGLLSMVRGIAGMVGSPLAGYLYDSTGSYDLSFLIGGLLLLAGAVCHMFLHLPCLRPKPHPTEGLVDERIGEGVGSKPQIISIEEIGDTGDVSNSAV